MDGFARSDAADRYAYTQLPTGRSCRTTGTGREQFVLADNFFASAQGPSFPNHLYAIAAQSGGAHDNPQDESGA